MDERQFTVQDLRQWTEDGLITAEQFARILASEDVEASEPERDRGLNFLALLSYFGAFLALTGFAVFVAYRWDDTSPVARAVLATAAMAALSILGYFVRRRTEFRLAGSLFFLLGMAMVPIALMAVGGAIVEGESDALVNEDTLPEVTGLLAASLVLTAMAVALTRMEEAVLVPATMVVLLAAATAGLVFGVGEEKEIWTAVLVTAGAIVVASVVMRALRQQEYGFWMGAVGHLSFYVAMLALLAIIYWSDWSAALFLVIYSLVLLMSVPIQDRLFLIAGVLGIYTFVARLAFDVAEDSVLLPLAFTLIGISLIGLGMGYQRIRRSQTLNLRWL